MRSFSLFLRAAIQKQLGHVKAALADYESGLAIHSRAYMGPGIAYSGPDWNLGGEAEMIRREAASLLDEATPSDFSIPNKP